MLRFEQLKRDVLNHIRRKGAEGVWPSDTCFERLVEELGELARARRPKELWTNHPKEEDEEGEVLDIFFTLICYSIARGFDLEKRWVKDTHGDLEHNYSKAPAAKVECPDCGKDWGHGYCGTCKGLGYITGEESNAS